MAQPGAAPFSVYKPLDDTRNEIRLLEVLPAGPASDNIVHCSLSTCSLDDGPTYTALSYVWGDPDQTRPVVVNGHEVQVTTNLVDALLQLRTDKVTTLWVDALCIDQKNNDEKGHQVQKMKNIYKMANEVVAWLGGRDEKSRRGILLMKELARVARSVHLQDVYSPLFRNLSKDQRQDLMEDICKPLLSPSSMFSDGDLGLIILIMEKEYWRRLWIIQEISLARSATVLCGPDKVRWEDIQSAMAVFKWLRFFFSTPPDGYETFQVKLNLLFRPFEPKTWLPPSAIWVSVEVNGKEGTSLLDLLMSTCYDTKLECSNPRDRIYALFGLMCEEDRDFTTVDYSRSPTDLFVQTTLFMFQRYGSQILLYAGLDCRDEGNDERNLPSWAVDWCCTRARMEQLANYMKKSETEFSVRTLEDNEIAFDTAMRSTIIEVIPSSKNLRSITQKFEQVQRQHHLERPEDSSLPVRSLKVMIWRTLLYNSWLGPLSPDEVNELFEECVRSPIPAVRSDCQDHDNEAEALGTAEDRTFEDLLWIDSPRNLFITAEGVVGSGPPCTQKGDVIHVIRGLDFPLILRPDKLHKGKKHWKHVGCAYVDDMFSGDEEGKMILTNYWATDPKVEEIILT